MTLTFTDTERMRLALNDPVPAIGEPLLAEAVYAEYLAIFADWRLAAASLAEVLAARAINDPTSFARTGKVSFGWSDRAKNWLELAKRLRAQVAASATGGDGFGFAEAERVDTTIRADYSVELRRA